MTTYSTIQTLTNNNASPVAEEILANDDVSVAKRIADDYIAAGLDPAMAYDDPATAVEELGLKQYGF